MALPVSCIQCSASDRSNVSKRLAVTQHPGPDYLCVWGGVSKLVVVFVNWLYYMAINWPQYIYVESEFIYANIWCVVEHTD